MDEKTMQHLQRRALEERLKALMEQLRGEIAVGLRLPNHNVETDDAAVADVETSIEVAEVERATRTLREAVAALERLRDPACGTCGDCGARIPYERLYANPVATRCIECQQRFERGAPAAAKL